MPSSYSMQDPFDDGLFFRSFIRFFFFVSLAGFSKWKSEILPVLWIFIETENDQTKDIYERVTCLFFIIVLHSLQI